MKTYLNLDIVIKSGAWFSYNGEKIGQGRENAKEYLKNNPEIMAEVEQKVRANFATAFEKSLDNTLELKDDEDIED